MMSRKLNDRITRAPEMKLADSRRRGGHRPPRDRDARIHTPRCEPRYDSRFTRPGDFLSVLRGSCRRQTGATVPWRVLMIQMLGL